MTEDYFPHDTTDEWWAENWHCETYFHGPIDPCVATYYGFHRPTHVVIFLQPFTDLSNLMLVQVHPAPSRWRDPWILPGETEARLSNLPRAQWKAPR